MATQYEAEELLIGGSTDVYVADIGVAFPTTLAGSLSAWTHLGYTTEAGVRPNLNRNIFDIRASQSFYPVRRGVTSVDALIEFDLEQWNSDTVLLALGGGTITDQGSGVFKFTPAAPSFIDERQLLLHTTDGDKQYLWGYTRTQNTKNFQSALTRTAGSFLPIGMTVLDPGSSDAYFMLTNDPSFTAAS